MTAGKNNPPSVLQQIFCKILNDIFGHPFILRFVVSRPARCHLLLMRSCKVQLSPINTDPKADIKSVCY